MGIKRSLYFLTATLALLFFSVAAQGEGRPFITRWKGEAGKELKIPIFGTCYKLVIKKASDNSELKTEASLTITENENFYTYTPTEDGELLVEAGPEGVEYIRFVHEESKRGSAENLLTVEQFGTVVWKSMYWAFSNCKNMQFAPTVGTPDLSNVTNMRSMFRCCYAFNQALSGWNVSNVTDMNDMFDGCHAFNQELSSWDVSNVTDMLQMFCSCSAFNQDLSSWNVSNVTKMDLMFYGCSAFNQNLGSWNLKKCEELGLENCGMSIENYSKSLDGWAGQADIKEKLLLRADGLYFNETGKSARTKLIKEKHWVIRGDVSEGGRVYDLRIGGVQLSTDNINSFQEVLTEVGVLKKGKASVTLEGEKLVLLLENAELTAPYEEFPTYMLASYNGITIQLRGVCTITQLSYHSAIFVGDGTIVGRNINDKLLVKGHDVDCRTAIRNCTVEIEKKLDGCYGGALEIDNAVVKAKSIQYVVLTLKNCSILQPEGAHYDAAKEKVVDKDGNTAENVVIGEPITLDRNQLSLAVGKDATLKANVMNLTNKEVEWSCDKTDIATVDNSGKVTAKAVGNATITAKTKEGGYTATCEVSVTIPVTGVSLSLTELSLEKGRTATLTATVAPSDATNKKVTWSSNNTAVATVEEGTVTAVSGGTATITVTTEDGSHTATCEVTVTPPAAVEDAQFANVVVLPNPFDTQLRISNGDVRGKYALYNTQGVEVAFGGLECVETRINTASFPAGMYLLRLTAENGATKTFTVVKR